MDGVVGVGCRRSFKDVDDLGAVFFHSVGNIKER